MNSQMFLFLGGTIVLFLFSLGFLADQLGSITGDSLRSWIDKFTRTLYHGILAGLLATALLGSSSVVIILALSLVRSRHMNFRQAIGIVLGSNIGTTISSQIIAMDVGQYSALIMLLGWLISVMPSSPESMKKWGKVILGFGLIFFSMMLMEKSVEPLRGSETFLTWLNGLNDPWHGALLGGVITLVIQSSSATVGMAIAMGDQDLISASAGVAVMLGAELGTCSDTLIASLGGNRETIRTGLFHLLFNLITILLGLLLFPYFVFLVGWFTPHADLGHFIANAHLLFNLLGVILVLPLVGSLERFLRFIVPNQIVRVVEN